MMNGPKIITAISRLLTIIMSVGGLMLLSVSGYTQRGALSEMMYTVQLSEEQRGKLSGDLVPVKISFAQGPDGTAVFSEVHRINIGPDGRGQIIIGRGQLMFGSLEEVPWGTGDIYLRSEFQLNPDNPFQVVSNEQLWSVPYAYFARETAELVREDTVSLRSGTSAYWRTSGNTGNQPPYHVLGTMDDQDLVFKVNNEERMRLNGKGRLVVKAGSCCTSVDENDKNKYPVLVSGSNQGIWVEIKDKRNNAHNFMTFQDKDRILGRIEGETISEWESDEPYINRIKLFALEAASFVAQIAGEIANGSGEAPFPCSSAGSGFNFAFAAQLGVQLVNYGIRVADWQSRGRLENGIIFQTGGADYAEWLPLSEGTPDLEPGQVVGIYGGQASLNTDTTRLIRVVSTNPIVVGNLPPSGKTEGMERIAFLGQAPVRVAGPVKQGDYLLPSGNNDGYAMAVAPEDMRLADYPYVLGVAWESGKKNRITQLINAGIGVQTDLINQRMTEIEAKWQFIQDQLALESSGTGLVQARPTGSRTKLNPTLSWSEFEQVLEDYRTPIEEVFAYAREQLDTRGVDLQGIGELDLFYRDPIAFLKSIREDPTYASSWAIFDRHFKASTDE